MDCRRCGEPNLPGLEACFSCGLALAEEIPEPSEFAPAVKARSPLARRQRDRVRRDSVVRRRVAGLPWRRWADALPGIPIGLLPGLGPALRGDRRGALIQLAALLAPLILAALTWRTGMFSTFVGLTYVGWSLSVFQEIHRRIFLPDFWPYAAAFFLTFGAMAVARFGTYQVRQAIVPVVETYNQPNLDGGQFLVRPYRDAPIQIGDLVAVGEGGFYYRGSWVAPVVAMAGQTVTVERGYLYVDGVQTDVVPLNPARQYVNWGRQKTLTAGEGELILYANPLRAIAEDEVLGRIFYRWTPLEQRGPLDWPPETIEEGEENQEDPAL